MSRGGAWEAMEGGREKPGGPGGARRNQENHDSQEELGVASGS